MATSSAFNIVHEQNFIRATRSTGYRSTASAIAELIDNAIQANATRIDIFIEQSGVGHDKDYTISVADNGRGMNSAVLRTALRFGGTTRFNDRSGQGRFGMGLPNASLSQAQRLEAYSWQNAGEPLFSYIDVDEIADGRMTVVPAARRRKPPHIQARLAKASGTVIVWKRCDMLDSRKATTIARKLHYALGRQFRYFLWDGLAIRINGSAVRPVDPLFLKTDESVAASLFGKPLVYELHVPNKPSATSRVTVRFSELPLAQWHSLSVDEKQQRGISKGAGVSIVRAGREVDYGWYLFGNKRKENYDDWWRCEIAYEPALDDYFGITHSKQAINPTQDLKDILSSDLEAVANVLNSRARKMYAGIKVTADSSSPAAEAATRNDKYLPATSVRVKSSGKQPASRAASRKQPALRRFKIQSRRLNSPDFFVYHENPSGAVVITLNTDHTFYERVYLPSRKVLSIDDRNAIECFVIAAVRAELCVLDKDNTASFDAYRRAWSDAMEVFLDA